MNTRHLIFLLYLLIPLNINAQQMSSISGFARDNASGEPLSYVNVFVVVEGSYKGSATNQDPSHAITSFP